jgi:hypothetical protein
MARTDDDASDAHIDALVRAAANAIVQNIRARGTSDLRGMGALMADVVRLVVAEREADEKHRTDIRRFFLEPQEFYTVRNLAQLWRVSEETIRNIWADEIDRWLDSNALDTFRIAWTDAVGASATFHVFRPYDIECAFGDEFQRVFPKSQRTVAILIRIPLSVVATYLQRTFQESARLTLHGVLRRR